MAHTCSSACTTLAALASLVGAISLDRRGNLDWAASARGGWRPGPQRMLPGCLKGRCGDGWCRHPLPLPVHPSELKSGEGAVEVGEEGRLVALLGD